MGKSGMETPETYPQLDRVDSTGSVHKYIRCVHMKSNLSVKKISLKAKD